LQKEKKLQIIIGEQKYTFFENGEFEFEYININGENKKVIAQVDNIDKTVPKISAISQENEIGNIEKIIVQVSDEQSGLMDTLDIMYGWGENDKDIPEEMEIITPKIEYKCKSVDIEIPIDGLKGKKYLWITPRVVMDTVQNRVENSEPIMISLFDLGPKLSRLEIKQKPTNTKYIEGQNFDPTGMEIQAIYNDGITNIITDYMINNGENLTIDRTYVTISYTDNEITKTINQEILVEQKQLVEISIINEPSKKDYIEGQNFNPEGMEIQATYNNGTTNIIANYVIEDGGNLAIDKTYVTISYTENDITQTTTQKIVVDEKLKITSDKYGVQEKYINKIESNTEIQKFKEQILSNCQEMNIYNKDGSLQEELTIIETGMKIELKYKNQISILTLVVQGDANGDGKTDLRDIFAINKHRLNQVNLQNEYLLAGDFNQDGETDLRDIFQINKFRLQNITN